MRVKCRLGGTVACCSARMAFIMPTAPDADWPWPKLVLAEPSAHGPPVPYTAARLAYSIGSPTGVPVPWASTIPTVVGSMSPAANAAR